MDHVHLLSSAEAQKELTEAVKECQGSKRTASWKASARPSWWIDDHTVTLRNGTTVCTGTFDVNAKKKWRKGHFQAALFLYQQWTYGQVVPPSSKDETKIEEEIEEEITPAPRVTRRANKEEDVFKPRAPRKKGKGRGKKQGKPEPEEEAEEEKELQVRKPTRGRRNLRFKEDPVILKEKSPVVTPKTRSHRRISSSSMESDDSPTPIIRRKKTRGRQQKTSPQIETPIQKRQLKARKARNGRALVRNTTKTEARRESIPRPQESDGFDPDSTAAPTRLTGSASNSDDDFVPVRTRRRAKLPGKVASPAVQDNQRMSTRLSGSSTGSPPSPHAPSTRKRLISDDEGESKTGHPRTPLQERNDPSNLQKKISRKKRRTTESDDAPRDKENRAPPVATKSKPTRLRSAHGKNDKPGELEVAPNVENANVDNVNKEQDISDEAAEQERMEKRHTFLRECIKKVKAERDRHHGLIDDEFAKLELESNSEKTKIFDNWKMQYRMKKLKFSKQILEMPISRFAGEHGGDIDEWMMHDTEEGVNRTFQALHNGEDPNDRVMGPPKTPTAMSRRAALEQTARKTRKKVANEAAAAGLTTVRRSQRTAAKVATERTRAIVARTPRTVKKEVTIQINGDGGGRAMRGGGRGVVVASAADVCSRQQRQRLVQSIKQQRNPVEAWRTFAGEIEKELAQGGGGGGDCLR